MSAADFHLAGFGIPTDHAFGQTEDNSEGKHGSSDLIHRFHKEAGAQNSLHHAGTGLHQIGSNEGGAAGSDTAIKIHSNGGRNDGSGQRNHETGYDHFPPFLEETPASHATSHVADHRGDRPPRESVRVYGDAPNDIGERTSESAGPRSAQGSDQNSTDRVKVDGQFQQYNDLTNGNVDGDGDGNEHPRLRIEVVLDLIQHGFLRMKYRINYTTIITLSLVQRHEISRASFSIRSKNNSMNMRGRTPNATFIFRFFFS